MFRMSAHKVAPRNYRFIAAIADATPLLFLPGSIDFKRNYSKASKAFPLSASFLPELPLLLLP